MFYKFELVYQEMQDKNFAGWLINLVNIHIKTIASTTVAQDRVPDCIRKYCLIEMEVTKTIAKQFLAAKQALHIEISLKDRVTDI